MENCRGYCIFCCIYYNYLIFALVIISFLCLVLSGMALGLNEILKFHHGRSIFANHPEDGFFGKYSYLRKYANVLRPPETRKKYHQRFALKYQERFFLSGTVLVFLTDAFHFTKWLFKTLLFIAFACIIPVFNQSYVALIAWSLFSLGFMLGYYVIFRR